MRETISSRTFRLIANLIPCVAALLAILTFSSSFIIAYVPTGSMYPTIQPGDVVLSTKLFSRDSIEREDIVTFDPYTEESRSMLPPGEGLHIKRVVGLPGDKVEVRDGTLYVNDEPMVRSYTADVKSHASFDTVTVPEGCYFMMGDNRCNSLDSRDHGPIPYENLKGKALFHTRNPWLRLFDYLSGQ